MYKNGATGLPLVPHFAVNIGYIRSIGALSHWWMRQQAVLPIDQPRLLLGILRFNASVLGASMDGEQIDLAAACCREAAEVLGRSGSFRLRTLMQMALLELEKELASRDRQSDEKGAEPEPSA